MSSGSIFISKQPCGAKPGDRVQIGGVEMGTVDRVENQGTAAWFSSRVYVKWDKDIEIGSYMPRRGQT